MFPSPRGFEINTSINLHLTIRPLTAEHVQLYRGMHMLLELIHICRYLHSCVHISAGKTINLFTFYAAAHMNNKSAN